MSKQGSGSGKKNLRVTTPDARLSFPQLDKPVAYLDSPPKYGAEFIIEKTEDISHIQKACAAVLEEKFPDLEKRPKLKNPIIDGSQENARRLSEGLEPRPEIEGKWVIKARTGEKWPPKLYDPQVQPFVGDITNTFKAGYVVRASVTPYYYDVEVKRGITFALNAVQFVRQAEEFGSPFDPNEAFGPIDTPMGSEEKAMDALFE